jgi:hypothetical protein
VLTDFEGDPNEENDETQDTKFGGGDGGTDWLDPVGAFAGNHHLMNGSNGNSNGVAPAQRREYATNECPVASVSQGGKRMGCW